MKIKRIQLLLAGVAAWIGVLLMITSTYGGSIVIGANYTDIGTIVIVSPKPGDTPLANGTALFNNLADITADANNRYVIKLGPGIYDLGTNHLQMKEYVDMEGSGENTTIIQGSIDNGGFGVVNGANNAEIRFLTVSNTGGGFYAEAISNSSASPKITNVTAKASGATSMNIGVYNHGSSPTMTNVTVSASEAPSSYGVYNDSASAPTMTNVTVTVSAAANTYGVTNISSSATMTNVTVNPSGGSSSNQGVLNLANSGRTVKINHSVIQGTTETISNGSGTTLVGNTQLDGGAVNNGGTLTCVGAYNGSYAALNASCQ